MSKKAPPEPPSYPRLHGWDDEKVYYLDETGHDHCIADMPDLLKELEALCAKRLATDHVIDMERPLDLVVLSVGMNAVRCRWLDSAATVTVRLSGAWNRHVFPGEIMTLQPRKHWRYARNAYLSGVFLSARLDAPSLGLTPLQLTEFASWDPEQELLEDDGCLVKNPANLSLIEQRIYAAGIRQQYEMEQILPGSDPDDMDSDPILDALDLQESGQAGAAEEKLMALLKADLRCLDAHAHLGNLWFDNRPEAALRHYAVGIAIGELSLPPDFRDLLPWGIIDNRPFLRCLNGYGLCLWRLNRQQEALAVFERLLWLNPTDNQGARFDHASILARLTWEDVEQE